MPALVAAEQLQQVVGCKLQAAHRDFADRDKQVADMNTRLRSRSTTNQADHYAFHDTSDPRANRGHYNHENGLRAAHDSYRHALDS
jgi:hypothetical protein